MPKTIPGACGLHGALTSPSITLEGLLEKIKKKTGKVVGIIAPCLATTWSSTMPSTTAIQLYFQIALSIPIRMKADRRYGRRGLTRRPTKAGQPGRKQPHLPREKINVYLFPCPEVWRWTVIFW